MVSPVPTAAVSRNADIERTYQSILARALQNRYFDRKGSGVRIRISGRPVSVPRFPGGSLYRKANMRFTWAMRG